MKTTTSSSHTHRREETHIYVYPTTACTFRHHRFNRSTHERKSDGIERHTRTQKQTLRRMRAHPRNKKERAHAHARVLNTNNVPEQQSERRKKGTKRGSRRKHRSTYTTKSDHISGTHFALSSSAFHPACHSPVRRPKERHGWGEA